MPDSSRYWDRVAHKYAARPIPDQAAYDRKLAATRRYLRPDMDVLELGCGSGMTAVLHAPFVRSIQGIDGSEKLIAIARQRGIDAKAANTVFTCTSIEAFDPGERVFNAVLGLNVLHLVDDWRATIRRVHELLAPGGVFVSVTPCITGRLWRLALPAVAVTGLIPRVRFIAPDDLTSALGEAGFHVEEQWHADKVPTVFLVVRKQ